MSWEIEYADEFVAWWEDLGEKEQVSVSASVDLLGLFGPGSSFPHSSDIKGARHGCALLLMGGDKTGQHRWYEAHVPVAEKLYDVHLQTVRKEGRKRG